MMVNNRQGLIEQILLHINLVINKIKMEGSIRHSLRVNIESRRQADTFNPLPTIQHRKHSLSIQTQSKNHHPRFAKFAQYEDSCNMANASPKEPSHQSIFTVPKNVYFFNSKIYVRNQHHSRHKMGETADYDSVRKQIEILDHIQKTQISQQQILFNAAINEFGLIQKTHQGVFKQNHPKKSHKRKSTGRQQTKQGKKLQFFNIQKLNLVNAQKIKKSTSLFVKAGSDMQNDMRNKNIKDLQDKIVRKKSIFFLDCHSPSLKDTISMDNIDDQQRTKTLQLKPNRLIKRQNLFTTLHKRQRTVQSKQKEYKHQRKRFIVPFQTYPYRDFIWKVNYTNRRFVQIPLDYQRKIKVYIGKGNNSCMVSGLISRRPWCTFTDKIEQANFVWTQLKQLTYFKHQQSFKGQISLQQRGDNYKIGSIMSEMDSNRFQAYFLKFMNWEQRIDEQLSLRQRHLGNRKMIKPSEVVEGRMQNHLINNYVIGNKKALFNTMSTYYKHRNQDVFNILPLTFHIKDGTEDPKYFQFLKYFHKRAKEISLHNDSKTCTKEYNAWIVKPGENSNRGHGIKMCLTFEQIKSIIRKRQRYKDGSYRTFIIQAYIERPLLYNKRKFDLRHYIMMTSINGIVKGYWYKEGYVRTTSSEYSLTSTMGSIHLTNDAVQKNLPDYGKYQKGNKISYEELSAYIDKNYHKDKSFQKDIYPKMKKVATDAMTACSASIDPTKLQNNFEVFGMDFMIDSNLQVWLIQINTNPCLELSCPLLASIIPKMVENALQLTLDAIFPPPANLPVKGPHFQKNFQKQNKFELVYDQRIQEPFTATTQILDKKLLEEEEDTFEDCGQNWQDK